MKKNFIAIVMAVTVIFGCSKQEIIEEPSLDTTLLSEDNTFKTLVVETHDFLTYFN